MCIRDSFQKFSRAHGRTHHGGRPPHGAGARRFHLDGGELRRRCEREDWMVYHANSSASGGCDMNRSTRAQKFTWNADGTPNLGTPALGVTLTAPSGE